jgi:L-alanine-DL-glutamate epimerase-like enolase superfamily enzyme
MHASLHVAKLHYRGGLILHTASSGSVPHLEELYFYLRDGERSGIGEVRTNIAYLNGLASKTVMAAAIAAAGAVDWSRDPVELLRTMPEWAKGMIAPVRMLIDGALHDLAARDAGMPLAAWIGGDAAEGVMSQTNQTLFWSSDESFLTQAEAYVERGFRDLKVRIGVEEISADLRRIAALRERYGATVKIAADANGQWSEEAALANLRELARFDLAYVEQPVAAGDWELIARVAESSRVPMMLDESIVSADDVERVCGFGGQVLAHLKLVKLGGIVPLMEAARKLAAAGASFMVGQMNEGAAATAAALHCTCATCPVFAELYGADGLDDDPVRGISYREGAVKADPGPGLGVNFDAAKTHLIWEN